MIKKYRVTLHRAVKLVVTGDLEANSEQEARSTMASMYGDADVFDLIEDHDTWNDIIPDYYLVKSCVQISPKAKTAKKRKRK